MFVNAKKDMLEMGKTVQVRHGYDNFMMALRF